MRVGDHHGLDGFLQALDDGELLLDQFLARGAVEVHFQRDEVAHDTTSQSSSAPVICNGIATGRPYTASASSGDNKRWVGTVALIEVSFDNAPLALNPQILVFRYSVSEFVNPHAKTCPDHSASSPSSS